MIETIRKKLMACILVLTVEVGGVVGNDLGTVQHCYYDKQMCPVGGKDGVDSEDSAEGQETTDMTVDAVFDGWSSVETGAWNFTADLYPRLTGYVDGSTDYEMDATDAAFVSASPVFWNPRIQQLRWNQTLP